MTKREMLYGAKKWVGGKGKKCRQALKSFRHICDASNFDPWTQVARLELEDIIISGELFYHLIKTLKLSYVRVPGATGSATGNTTSTDEDPVFIELWITTCSFAVRDCPHNLRRQNRWTLKKIHSLCSTIADRAFRLELNNSHEILSFLLSTPHIERLVAERLFIDQRERLTPVEYERLGKIICNSAQLRDVEIHLPVVEGSHLLFEGFENINIENLEVYCRQCPPTDLRSQCIAPLTRLLQHPQSKLRKLILCSVGLDDQLFISILQALLASSRIVELELLSTDSIGERGILEFARQLPRIHTLKLVKFKRSDGFKLSDMARRKIAAALRKGIMKNTSLHTISGLPEVTHYVHLQYYLFMNYAGRRLLNSSQPIPDVLWPRVLQRAGFPCREVAERCERFLQSPRYDAVYFLLRNCPGILSSFR